jgi:hypothetical protein
VTEKTEEPEGKRVQLPEMDAAQMEQWDDDARPVKPGAAGQYELPDYLGD